MSSVSEAEIGTILITAKELVPVRQTLIYIGWPHTPNPIQIDNYTGAGVVNETIIAQKTKSMDLKLH